MTIQGGDTPETATYIFTVCPLPTMDRVRELLARLSCLPGMQQGEPVRILPFADLLAIVQRVLSADFQQENLRQRLMDRQELERCARAHHEVVTATATIAPTVPLALATLYHTDERARQALTQDADRFRAALRRISGHVEWGVKLFMVPPSPAAAVPIGNAPTATASSGSGLAYLTAKRGAYQAREQSRQQALHTADQVYAALSELASAARRLQVHEATKTAGGHTQILNATFLVANAQSDDFAARARSLATTWTRIEMTGPWAPYSFGGV